MIGDNTNLKLGREWHWNIAWTSIATNLLPINLRDAQVASCNKDYYIATF